MPLLPSLRFLQRNLFRRTIRISICLLIIYNLEILETKYQRLHRIKTITIKGERQSGIKQLKQILSISCPNLAFDDYNYGSIGWPYGLMREGKRVGFSKSLDYGDSGEDIDESVNGDLDKEASIKLRKHDFVIFLFRNYSTWLPEMKKINYENNYELPKNTLKMSMKSFLNSPFVKKGSNHDLADSDINNQDLTTIPDYEKNWNNVLTMRASKYKSWLKFIKTHTLNTMPIRFEELQTEFDIRQLIRKLRFFYGLDCNYQTSFKKFYNWISGDRHELDIESRIDKLIGINNEEMRKVENYEFSEEEMIVIKDFLDREVESSLGYM